MCGIIGYLGEREAVEIIVGGLERLEYRGYDSAGIALLDENGSFQIKRCKGKLIQLKELLNQSPISGTLGVGHTRWATHGRPSEENAHPHRVGDTIVVHNGIIENYLDLKRELGLDERTYVSETDTEVIAHLVEYHVKQEGDFFEGVRNALLRLRGSYAVAILNKNYPRQIIAARNESPLVVGLGEGEYFIASDIPAFLPYTRKVNFINDREIAVFKEGEVHYYTLDRDKVSKRVETIHWSPVMAERAGYNHFMQKEIFEQPRAITDTFRSRVSIEKGQIHLDGLIDNTKGMAIDRVIIVACGTSFHAGLVGKFFIEQIARIPVDVELGSEFRYRDPIISPASLMICISQSGETADTLAALREGKRKGARTVGICNVVGSSLVRETDSVIYTYAGPEICVASTKAFTTQLTILYLIALYLGQITGGADEHQTKEAINELLKLPHHLEETLAENEKIKQIAHKYFQASDFLYLGRGINYPIALEGALKLKEISYIHAEGYAAGEMKHGPIALIDEKMPVVVLITEGQLYPKIISNIREVKARFGKVIALTNVLTSDISEQADDIVQIPSTPEVLSPIVMTIPLQLLAYYISILRGTDVDQPRNLAKSVTVE